MTYEDKDITEEDVADEVVKVNKYTFFEPSGESFHVIIEEVEGDIIEIDPFDTSYIEGEGDMKRTGAIYENWDLMVREPQKYRDGILSRRDRSKVKIRRGLLKKTRNVYVLDNGKTIKLEEDFS